MINLVIEGESDRGVANAVLRCYGLVPHRTIVARGKNRLDEKIAAYNNAARHGWWFVLRDADGQCPVELRHTLFPHGLSDGMVFRLACTMSEAWLMADPETFSQWFKVSPASLPAQPEELPHAKRTLLDVCSGSRSREIREGLVSTTGRPGALYVAELNDYAEKAWRPHVASHAAPSLARALRSLEVLAATMRSV